MRCDTASRRCVGQGGQQLRATLDGLGSHRTARRPRAVVAHRSPRGCRHTGAEFRLVVGAQAQWHQAKRQRAGGPWTVSALAAPAAHFRQLRSAWWDPAEAEVYRALHSVDVRTIDEKQLG
jgi:hypothetical protein